MIAYPFRNRVIWRCYSSGAFTYEALGEIFNLSRTRISHIYHIARRRHTRRQTRKQHPDNMLDYPTECLDVSVRVRNMLACLRLATVKDVLAAEVSTLLRHPNFGRKSLNDLKRAIWCLRERYKK